MAIATASRRARDAMPEELTAIAAGYGIEIIGPPGIPA
jgi:hypothetical protein